MPLNKGLFNQGSKDGGEECVNALKIYAKLSMLAYFPGERVHSFFLFRLLKGSSNTDTPIWREKNRGEKRLRIIILKILVREQYDQICFLKNNSGSRIQNEQPE